MTLPSPTVRRSVQTGTRRERITAPRPIFVPSARRYRTYSGDPANRTSGFRWTSVFTTQKRRYAGLQTRIGWGFQRPTSTHFAAIGRRHTPRKAAAANRTDRRYTSMAREPAEIH